MTFDEWWAAYKFDRGIFSTDPNYDSLFDSHKEAWDAGRAEEREAYANRANAGRE